MTTGDSTSHNYLSSLMVAALGPQPHQIPIVDLRRSGLHADIVAAYFEAFLQQLDGDMDWRPLCDFGYSIRGWRDPSPDHVDRAPQLTATWRNWIENLGISEVLAIQLYDGETRQQPAPDFRLYLLQDGRLVHYAGGFYGRAPSGTPILGDIRSVLADLDERYARHSFAVAAAEPFIILLTSFADVLKTVIERARRKLAEQEALTAQLAAAMMRLSAR